MKPYRSTGGGWEGDILSDDDFAAVRAVLPNMSDEAAATLREGVHRAFLNWRYENDTQADPLARQAADWLDEVSKSAADLAGRLKSGPEALRDALMMQAARHGIEPGRRMDAIRRSLSDLANYAERAASFARKHQPKGRGGPRVDRSATEMFFNGIFEAYSTTHARHSASLPALRWERAGVLPAFVLACLNIAGRRDPGIRHTYLDGTAKAFEAMRQRFQNWKERHRATKS